MVISEEQDGFVEGNEINNAILTFSQYEYNHQLTNRKTYACALQADYTNAYENARSSIQNDRA